MNLNNIAFYGNGGIQLRVLVENSNDTLTDIGDSTTINATTQHVSVAASAGDTYFVWVYGYNFSTGYYSLDMNMA